MPYSQKEIDAQKAEQRAAEKERLRAAAAAEAAQREAQAQAEAARKAAADLLNSQKVASALASKATATQLPCGRWVNNDVPEITDHTVQHIVQGHHNGNKSTGCHSKLAIDNGFAKIEDDPPKEVTADPPGLYKVDISVKKSNGPPPEYYKPKMSTFFPDDWNQRRILAEVKSAFTHPGKVIDPMEPRSWTAKSASGVVITGFTDDAGNISSAFPTGAYAP